VTKSFVQLGFAYLVRAMYDPVSPSDQGAEVVTMWQSLGGCNNA
jgi:hypothetical protein